MWRYGDAGDRIPVRVGDVWKVGEHILACGDLEMGAGDEFLQLYGIPDYVYVDPPWNAGNAMSFRTKAGVRRPVDFGNLISRVFNVAKKARELIYLEMGVNATPMVRNMVEDMGGHWHGQWKITYYHKRPCVFAGISFNDKVYNLRDYTGVDDDMTAMMAFEGLDGSTVMDMCMGRGKVAVCGELNHMRVFGVELHPRRLAVTIDRVVKIAGYTPEKIGYLSCMK